MIEVDQHQLIDAIRALPDHPRFARAAVFDADHTLWSADLGDDAFRLALREGLFREEAGPGLRRILERIHVAPTGRVHEDAARIHARYMEGGAGEKDIIEAELICYAGWTIDALRGLARRLLEEGLRSSYHEETEPIVRALEAEGYRIHVVSGSPHWLVQEAVESLGVHADHAVGARVRVEGGVLTDQLEAPVTFWEGKVEAFRLWLGDQNPKVVFGDSDGDLAMLLSAQLAVAVNPRPGLKASLEARRNGAWYHFMPRRTLAGRAIVAHDTDRIIL